MGLSSAAPTSGAGVNGDELESSNRAHPASRTAVVDRATTAARAVRDDAPSGFMVRTLRNVESDALITTASDTRVVRLAQGDVPKDILTGIPRGAAGVRGSLEFYTPNELLVLTGDNGDPVAADDVLVEFA